jgi:hypothetical protein
MTSDQIALIGALGQVFAGISAFVIAWIAYSYTKRATKMQFIFSSAGLINEWNKTILSRDDYMQAVREMRGAPSGDFTKDYLMFNLLTYLETVWRLKQQKVYRGPLVDAEIVNVLAFFKNRRPYLKDLLDRGYGSDFAVEMLRAFDASAKASAA